MCPVVLSSSAAATNKPAQLPQPPIPPPVYPPLPPDGAAPPAQPVESTCDAKHFQDANGCAVPRSKAPSTAAPAAPAAAAGGVADCDNSDDQTDVAPRAVKRARTSSLSRLPPPRAFDANRVRVTVVEDVETCLERIASELDEHSFELTKLERGSKFWAAAGAVVAAASPVPVVVASAPVASAASAADTVSAHNPSISQSSVGSSSSAEEVAVASQRTVLSVSSSASASVSVSNAAIAAAAVAASNVGVAKAESESNGKRAIPLQQRIMTLLHKCNRKDLIASVSQKNSVRLEAVGRRGAHLWLSVMPVESALSLSNGEFMSAMRHLLGLSPIASDWHCRCGRVAEAGHFHACNRVHGPATNTRHETVISELSSFARSHLSLHVEQAPSIAAASGDLIPGERHVVPDVVFRGADLQLAIDVSFVFTESEGRLVQMSEHGRSAHDLIRRELSQRARAKAVKYKAVCEREQMDFEAFVGDSHGTLDASALAVIYRLVKYGADQLGLNSIELRSYFMRRVAVAVQRGNARLDRHALALSRGGYGAAVALGYAQPRSGSLGGAREL